MNQNGPGQLLLGMRKLDTRRKDMLLTMSVSLVFVDFI